MFPVCPQMSMILMYRCNMLLVNSSQNNKSVDWSKFKALADDNFNVAHLMEFVFDSEENIVGKGENAGLPAFSPFPTMFLFGFFSRILW